MRKVNNLKQMDIYILVDSVRKEQVGGKGSYGNKYILQRIHELPFEEVGNYHAIYVWALKGYFAFWKTQKEYLLLTKTGELSEEEIRFVFFFREMSCRKKSFRRASNIYFSEEVLKNWEFFK